MIVAALQIAIGLGSVYAETTRGTPTYLVESWQTDQGLPQNSVISMAQTRDGYLWLATFNGLVRFDGVRFKVFDAQNTPALNSSRIVRVWEDRSGVLWIGTESGGIAILRNGEFIRLRAGDQALAHLNYLCDGERPGEVWLSLSNGKFLRFDKELKSVPLSWQGSSLGVLAPVGGGTGIQLITDKGMFQLDGPRARPTSDEGLKYVNRGDIVCGTSAREWWRTFDGRILKFNGDTITVDHGRVNALKAPVVALFEDSRSALWIGTAGAGVVRIHSSGERETIGDEYGLGHAHVSCFLEDREGNMWLGTDGSGLFRLRRGAFGVAGRAQGLGAEVALAVAERDGELWIGTNGGGVTRWGRDGMRTFVSPPGAAGLVHVWTLLVDGEKNLWIGTWGAGVFREKGGVFQSVPELSVLKGVVLASHQAADGTLWFGGQSGLASWSDGKVRLYTRADGLTHEDVRAIADDGEGGLWIGTNGGGVNRFRQGKFAAIRRGEGLVDDSVWTLYRDAQNRLWVGSFGGGVSVIEKGQISNFTVADGLPSGVICSISEDELGQMWMSSYSGVFRTPKSAFLEFKRGSGASLDCLLFTKSDGLPSRECTGSFQPSVCKTSDGRLVFPTVKGVATIDPRKLETNRLPPPVIIEEAEVDERIVPLAETGSIVIPPGSGQTEFRYTALSFSAPEKVRFRYKLQGLDTDWQDAGVRRSAYYSHLPPGEYEFLALAANNDGVWNRAGAAVRVRVIPSFWQTWWFRAACVLIVGGAIAGTIRYIEVSNLRRRMELLEQQHAVERERARIAKDIHDDLGASLTQITLLSELARTDLPNPTQAESHIRQISGTARELTRAMDEIVWAVNPQNDTLEDLLTYTVKFAQEHLRLAKIGCRVDAPAHLPPLHLSADIRHNLFLALKEAINNVAKHSKASEAWLRLRCSEKQFVLEIEDNGIGLAPEVLAGERCNLSTPGSHNGLRNMERRLREIGGSFQAVTRPEGGSIIRMRVEVRPPELGAAHDSRERLS